MFKAFGGLGWIFSDIEVIVFSVIYLNPSFAVDNFDLLKSRSVCYLVFQSGSFMLDLGLQQSWR